MVFYAHSTERKDKSDWETIAEHVALVEECAARFGAEIGIETAARLAARLHDLGKYNPEFQRRLEDNRIRVDHSTAGARLLLDEAERHFANARHFPDRVLAQLVAQGIAGHHAGLPDWQGSDDANLRSRSDGYDMARLDPAWRTVLPLDLSGLMPASFRPAAVEAFVPFQIAMLGRMIFSCLVDADFKATERFYVSQGEVEKDRDWPTLAQCLPGFLEGFAAEIARFGPPKDDLGALRADILDHVRKKATMEPGLFTLNVPTGGGKTLASLGFALDHVKRHGHRRIIVAIPFTSIIDQTADTFRRVLGAENVLEHHSAIEGEERRGKGADEADSSRSTKDKMRLAMEDWAAPVVVTTHVQLFESLFAARTSRVRKLHNIANSVIVLDEAQVLPRGLLGPTVRAIDELARNWGCTVLLCTATQPAFDARHYETPKTVETTKPPSPLALTLEGRELAPDPPALHRALKRTTLVHAGTMSDEALVEALGPHRQALVIVNSRAHALALYRLCEAARLDGLVHLTTRQYAAHRRTILADVRARLAEGTPCRLIATSLIEAGVDVDFPVSWRAEAGLDQIVQAAGRVNREGKRSVAESVVTVFKPAEAKPPPEVEGLIGDMDRMKAHYADLMAPDALDRYFKEVYWRLDTQIDRHKILSDLILCSKRKGLDVSYRTIAERYRMIETVMMPVIVCREAAARAAVDKLGIPTISSGAIARELQLFLVQTPRDAFKRLLDAGAVAFHHLETRGSQFAILHNADLYTDEVGLYWDDPTYRRSENMIF